MIPQRFSESNIVMKAPPSMENCRDVHAYAGHNQFITAWRPSPEELVKINLGEPIWLSVMSDRMPPVMVTANYPFQEQPSDATPEATPA